MKLGQLQSHYDPELSRAKAGQKDPSGVHTCMKMHENARSENSDDSEHSKEQ